MGSAAPLSTQASLARADSFSGLARRVLPSFVNITVSERLPGSFDANKAFAAAQTQGAIGLGVSGILAPLAI